TSRSSLTSPWQAMVAPGPYSCQRQRAASARRSAGASSRKMSRDSSAIFGRLCIDSFPVPPEAARPGSLSGPGCACQSGSVGRGITVMSTAEDDVLPDGDGVGGLQGGDGEFEAIGGVVVGVDPDVDAAGVGDDGDMGGAAGGGDAQG